MKNETLKEIGKLIEREQPRSVYIVTSSGVQYVAVKGRVFKRVGECARCGRCCVERIPILYEEWKDENGKCKHLATEVHNGKVRYLCKIHSNKPFGCFMYPCNPLNPDDIPEYCSYRWEEIK